MWREAAEPGFKIFDELDKRQDSVDAEIGASDDFDIVALLAKCRFYRLMIDVELADTRRFKTEMEERFGGFTRKSDGTLERIRFADDAPIFSEVNKANNLVLLARYDQIWSWLEHVTKVLPNSPDVLALAGESPLELGIRTANISRIRTAHGLLLKANSLKPTQHVTQLISRAQSELKIK